MRFRAVTILIGACVLSPALASADPPSQEAWRALFTQKEPAKATRRIEVVLKACDNDPAKLRALIAADEVYPAVQAGWQQRTVKLLAGETTHETTLSLRVPKDYTPTKSYPLVLAAHWQGGDGASIGRSVETLLGDAVEQYIVLAPTLPNKQRGFVASDLQVQGYLTPLAWARTNLNVDDDRIYVTGYGQGAYVCWHLAVMYPHLFAGAVPMAGLPYFEGAPYTLTSYLENLDALSVWAIWGEKDVGRPQDLSNAEGCRMAAARLKQLDNAHFKGSELPGAEHATCWPAGRDLRRFFESNRRQAVPAQFRHYFHRPQHARAYCLEAIQLGGTPIDFSQRIRIDLPPPKGEEPTREEVLAAAGRYLSRRMFKLRAELDRSKNSLTIQPLGVTRVRVYVMDGLFDLSKPAELRFGRVRKQGELPVSLRCILKHYAATRDATALICNEVDLDLTGKVEVRYR